MGHRRLEQEGWFVSLGSRKGCNESQEGCLSCPRKTQWDRQQGRERKGFLHLRRETGRLSMGLLGEDGSFYTWEYREDNSRESCKPFSYCDSSGWRNTGDK